MSLAKSGIYNEKGVEGMDEQTALKYIIAFTVCASNYLGCSDCPLVVGKTGCKGWEDEQIVDAVSVVKKELLK